MAKFEILGYNVWETLKNLFKNLYFRTTKNLPFVINKEGIFGKSG